MLTFLFPNINIDTPHPVGNHLRYLHFARFTTPGSRGTATVATSGRGAAAVSFGFAGRLL